MKNMKKLFLIIILFTSPFAGAAQSPKANSVKPAASQQLSQDKINKLKMSAPTGIPAAKTATLPHSRLLLNDGAFWVHQWIMNQPTGISLSTISSFDSALLMTFSGGDFTYLNTQKATNLKEINPNTFEWSFEDDQVDYKRIYEISGETVSVNVAIKFKNKAPEKAFLNLVSRGSNDDPESRDREVFYYTDSKIERKNVDKNIEPTTVQTPIRWVGAGSRYFVFAVLPEAAPEKLLVQSTGEYNAQASLQYPINNQTLNTKFKLVFAPKQLDTLRGIDKTLDTTVNLGFFTFIAYPILWFLKFIYKFVPNYGLAIIILTIIIKILTYPLVYKSMKGMKKMAEVQPKIKALQEKHKGNKEALNREMMEMMKTSGYNPMAGCLPMLIQMPIFFALYSVLYAAVELYRAPFAFWIHDLSLKDPYYVTPVLMCVVMFLQQKMTPPSPGMDATQRKMMMFMPLMFGAFMITTPSGLCIYMLVNSVVSVIQQQYLNKKLGVGNVAGMAPGL